MTTTTALARTNENGCDFSLFKTPRRTPSKSADNLFKQEDKHIYV